MEKKEIEIENIKIVYYENLPMIETSDVTNIKTIVFLHGWGGDKENLRLIYNSFINKNVRLIVLDLPGFGESTKPDDSFGSQEYSKLLEQFFDKINVKNSLFVGHSFGGKLSLVISFERPDIVSKLVLISASCLRNKRNLSWFMKVYSYKFLKTVIKIFSKDEKSIENLRKKFGSDDYKSANNMRKILVNVVNEDYTDLLKIIRIPVFLYWGEKDSSTPIWMAKKMKKLLKDCGLYVVKDGTHYPFLSDLTIVPIIENLLK